MRLARDRRKAMGKLFRYDSPFVQWINRMGKLVFLNMLWLICCLPLLTAGASTVAMYRVAMDLAARKEDVAVSERFLQAFRSNLKQATLVWLILLVPTLLVLLNLAMLLTGVLKAMPGLLAICILPAPPLLFVHAYAYAYVATFEDKPLRTLLNCAILSISNLPRTLLMVALNLLPLAIFLFATELFLRLLFVWLLFAFALIAYLNSKLLSRAFAPYMKK